MGGEADPAVVAETHARWDRALAAEPERGCLRCRKTVSAAAGFFELIRQPSGDRYTLCTLACLEAFVRGVP